MSIAISIDIIRHISQKQLKQSAEKVTFYKNLKVLLAHKNANHLPNMSVFEN